MKHPYPLRFNSLAALSNALGATCEDEANWLNRSLADVMNERQQWISRGVRWNQFLRKWRELNALDVASYCRLTGAKRRVVGKAMEWGDIHCELEPLTYTARLSVKSALLQGFTWDEIRRARAGDNLAEERFAAELVQAVRSLG
jgi:hypothetical protein